MPNEKGKKKNTASLCAELANGLAAELGVSLWDVVFEKEGAIWYLRYYIDKEGGVDIDTCEAFSRRVSDLLDAADPISQSYCLEVGSPGIERRLTKPAHFARYTGSGVLVRLIRPVEGVRDFEGTLEGLDEEGNVRILLDEETEMVFTMEETAFVRLVSELE